MKKIINYWILSGRTPNELTAQVTDFIKDGWQPHGPMVSDKYQYFQPMVKYEEEENSAPQPLNG